ncbi:thiolase family protein [Ornithinimicrobium humiphilum]|uniref:Acetyl-CoA acetyltransferase n=1 Tax=Ornithinimicrobium humiphilum TaxID=125288 RepID=A0A543KRT0_9MICO|nr:thiolase family protein [Ornithinimicrobium humiphilum]TQM97782.1 acetyl-CoA acetyltransferase [Ornithinimicrobium humiphilum]
MSRFPRVAVAGIGVTRQARRLEGVSTLEACLEAARIALDDAGLTLDDVDGIAGRWPGPGGTVFHPGSLDWGSMLGIPLRWVSDTYPQGIPAALEAAAAIEAGLCSTVLILGGQAGELAGGSVASYTRPDNEFVATWGAFTAAQFALVAQRYLHVYGVEWERIARVAVTIRNHGHDNPDAVMHGRGPYTLDDVLAAPRVAEPFGRLDLCLANEGAAAMVITSESRALDLDRPVVRIVGGGCEWYRQQYVQPARYEEVGMIGQDAVRRAYEASGLTAADLDVLQVYDVNSFEVVRQLEVLGFCGQGEGADLLDDVDISRTGDLPVNTDGGLMSFSHIGWGAPTLRIVEAVRQLRGEAGARQVPGARTAMAGGAGAGAQYYNVLLLQRD